MLDRLRALFSSRTDIADVLALLDLDAHSLDAVLRNASALAERWLTAPPIEMRSLVRDIVDKVIIDANRVDVRVNRAKIAAALQARVHGNPDLDPLVLSLEAKLRRAGKGKRLIIANGAKAEVNRGLVELIKEAFAIRNQLFSGSDDSIEAMSAYIPMAHGFLYLVAVMDWASRAVLSWRLSNTMDSSFCIEVLEEALARFGKPEIFNTDQGSQFTSTGFTDILKRHEIKISMDGRGRWMDNVFVERLWRSLKHEDIYLKGYADGREARAGISLWMIFYNTRRRHQALADRTPMAVWRENVTAPLGAKTVDMMDNTSALTTCPQQKQQTQPLAA